MRLVERHTSAAELAAKIRFTSYWVLLQALVGLWVLASMLVMRPAEAHAAKQKPSRKETPKAKSTPPTAAKSLQARKALLHPREPIALDSLDKRRHLVRRTKRGDTLPGVLARIGLPQAERRLWTRSIQRSFGSTALPAGKDIHLYFTKTAFPRGGRAAGQLKALEVDYDDGFTLTWEKGLTGILFQKREKPYDVEVNTASATIESSLFEDGRKAGIQPTLLSQLADIFNWDIDLDKEIGKGDSFKILYEKRSRKGQETKASLRILAAELISAGRKLTAIYFEKQKGQGNYYNLEGQSLARSFLRFPLEFTSITSRFTHLRFHPLLRVNLPHTGVDFAAQRGTPVRAVGDGIITQAGWNGAYGKMIEIQHDSTYTTRYAHLDRFDAGIHSGVAVKKGQVIGFVGSTGRTTGPHLHFELYKDQQYVDPLSVDFPADEKIEPALRKLFDNQKQLFIVELASAPPQS